jgi:hypothetical protein
MKTALATNKKSLLLHFYAVEMDEINKDFDAGKEKFELLLAELQKKIDSIKPFLDMLVKFSEKKTSSKPTQIDTIAPNTARVETTDSTDEDGESIYSDEESVHDMESFAKSQVYLEKEKELQEYGRLISLVWIQYMTFSRRTEVCYQNFRQSNYNLCE